MKNVGPLVILLAAFLFVGAVLSMVSVATTEYQHLTYQDSKPTDPEKIQESKETLHSTFHLGVVLGVAAVLVLGIGLATLGANHLQNKMKTNAIAASSTERGENPQQPRPATLRPPADAGGVT